MKKPSNMQVGMVAALIVVIGLGVASVIRMSKLKPDIVAEIVANHDEPDNNVAPVPIQVPTRCWETDTQLFLQAIRLHEDNLNECPENPWQFGEDYLADCYEFHPELRGGDLSNIEHAAKLVRVYNTRYKALNDQHAASMHRKGPSGCTGVTGQEYGWRVQNTIWDWETRQVTDEPVSLNSMGKEYTTPAPWAKGNNYGL